MNLDATPETDALEEHCALPHFYHEWKGFALCRKLERERNYARSVAEKLDAFRTQVMSACDEVPNPDPLPWK